MPSCNHKQRACETCSLCPRCPECICKGPKRPRGRPPKLQTLRRTREAAIAATSSIKLQNAISEAFDVPDATKPMNRYCNSPGALLAALGLPKWELRNVPSNEKRKGTMSSLSGEEVNGMQRFLQTCLAAITKLLLPSDSHALYQCFIEDSVRELKLRKAIVEGIKAADKGSLERRVLQGLICATHKAIEVNNVMEAYKGDLSQEEDHKKIISNDGTEGLRRNEGRVSTPTKDGTKFRCHVNGCILEGKDSNGSAFGHHCRKCAAPIHAYCCERILRIAVTDSTTPLYCSKCHAQPSLETVLTGNTSLKRKMEFPDNVSQAKQRRASGYLSRMYQQSRKEWDILLCTGRMPERKRKLQRCNDEGIRKALQYIFRAENIQLLSWGTKRIKMEGKWMEFPAVLRKTTCEKMYRGYQDIFSAEQGSLLRRSSFLQLVSTFTRGSQKRKSAVDYVLGSLVYDNLRVARDIVENEIQEEAIRKVFLSQLSAVEEFLKFVYLEHIESSDDPMHDQAFALVKCGDNGNAARSSECMSCLKPYQVIDDIQSALPEHREDIICCLNEVKHKIRLYMGHQHRCFNQEKRICAIFSATKSNPEGRNCIILMDYKMKFEAIRYREKSTEFFGKKGLSWHGSAIFYSSADTAEATTSSAHAVGASNNDDKLSTLFFDHVLSNDMTQDSTAVCSILDAVLARLVTELPQVTNITVLSDNARCYQNDLFPVMAPFIAKQHNLTLDSFVHSETQRGKSLVDAHFAIAMTHINRYCNETRNDVTTPGDVVHALNSFGGVANCTAEIIHLRRENPSMQRWTGAQKNGLMAKLGRNNEYLYYPTADGKFHVRAYAMSGRDFVEYIFEDGESRLAKPNRGSNNISQSDIPAQELKTTEPIQEADEYLNIVNPEEFAYQSTITGVTVWGRSRLRRQQRRRVRSDTSKRAMTLEVEEGIDDVMSSDILPAGMYICEKCGAFYRVRNAYSKHILSCKEVAKGDCVLNRASRMAFDMLRSPDAPIYRTVDGDSKHLDVSVSNAVIESCKLSSGWAHRPKHGETLGGNYISNYKEEIEKWFEIGEQDKGKKISASQMREVLRVKYSTRYDIPGEHNIISYISGLVRKKTKAQAKPVGTSFRTKARYIL